jgi:MFS family permease
MIKAATLGVIGVVVGTLAFALANGIIEYRTALGSRTYTIIDGVERDLTPDELVSGFLIGATVRAIPFGAIAAFVLGVPMLLVANALRSVPRFAAYLIAGFIGALAGGALSVLTWVVFGGWAPPFLIPAAACGSMLAPALVESCKAAATARARR